MLGASTPMPLSLPGALVAMLGFIVLMGLMFSSGGGAKSRQFAVVDQLRPGITVAGNVSHSSCPLA